jgi:hypothetical protein
MQKLIFTLFISFLSFCAVAQSTKSSTEILTAEAINIIFTDNVKTQHSISFPINKAYKCSDKSGVFYIVFTDSQDKEDKESSKIKAFNFQQENNTLVKKWEMNDFVIKQVNGGEMEEMIWFWTTYSSFTDIDNDGFIDPVIVYGTAGMNQTDDGRLKILLYYKGKKIAIRHQNGTLDFERNTMVDKAFYALPQKIQAHIKEIMNNIATDEASIFPSGWEAAMQQKKVKFDEK